MVLNTDQIVKAGRWQAATEKLGSFLHWKPPEVAHTPPSVPPLWGGPPRVTWFIRSSQFLVGPIPIDRFSPCTTASEESQCREDAVSRSSWQCHVTRSPHGMNQCRAGPRRPKQPSSPFLGTVWRLKWNLNANSGCNEMTFYKEIPFNSTYNSYSRHLKSQVGVFWPMFLLKAAERIKYSIYKFFEKYSSICTMRMLSSCPGFS